MKYSQEMILQSPSGYCMPFEEHDRDVVMSLGYGKQTNPQTGVEFFHHGVDFSAPHYLLSAVASGTVSGIGTDSVHGTYQVIRYGDYEVVYGHLSNILAGYGESVRAGQTVSVSGDILHMETKYKGEELDPIEFLTMIYGNNEGDEVAKVAQAIKEDVEDALPGLVINLQPMTKAELLRRYLTEHGFCVAAERLVLDKGTIYPVLSAEAGQSAPLTNAEAWCGAGLLHDPLYGDYARDRVKKLERAAAGLRQAKILDNMQIAALEADAVALREKIKEWEDANGTGN